MDIDKGTKIPNKIKVDISRSTSKMSTEKHSKESLKSKIYKFRKSVLNHIRISRRCRKENLNSSNPYLACLRKILQKSWLLVIQRAAVEAIQQVY